MKKGNIKFIKIAVLAIGLAVLGGLLPAAGWLAENVGAQTRKAAVKYAPVPAGRYNLDPAHSIIGFAVRHLEINWVEGRFRDFTGTINFDDRDVTKSTVEFTAKIDSIDTGVAPRDNHLKTPDFFDAKTYPEMIFKGTSIVKKGKDQYVLKGDLTMRGVTKPVELPFAYTGAITDPWGKTRFGIEAHTKINRRDFGINYGKEMAIGGFDVGNEVTINLQLEAVKAEASK